MKKILCTVPDNYEFDETNFRFKVNKIPNDDIVTLTTAKKGDKVCTNKLEDGEIVSTDGPNAFPYIILIHRIDTGRDDVGFWGANGKFMAYQDNYYISKLKNMGTN